MSTEPTPTERQAAMIADLEAKLSLADERQFYLTAELAREKQERTANNSLLVGQRNTAEADLAEAQSHVSTSRASMVEIASFTHEPQASAAATRALKLTQPWEDDDAKQS